MSDQKSEWHLCPNCKSVTVVFNSPLEFEVSESCGEINPDGYWCDLNKDHEGNHMHFMESKITW